MIYAKCLLAGTLSTEFCGAILHDFLQNVCISVLKALLVTMSGVVVNSNNRRGKFDG